MLGKRSSFPRTTSSRSLFIPCDDSDGDSSIFCNNSQVTGPALCSPRKIVIGFDVEVEKKPLADVCESPRSVLESSTVLSSHDKQQVVTRSPRSGLGSLLAAECGSKENVGTDVGIVSVASENSEHHERSVTNSPCKALSGLPKSFDHDPMDDDICACQGQVLRVNLQANMEDEQLDADISPLRAMGCCIMPKEEIKSDYNEATMPNPLSLLSGNTVPVCKVATNTSTECKEHKKIYANPSNAVGNPPFMHSCEGELCVHSPPVQFWRHSGMDVEYDHHQSIFSASSPPCSRSLARASSGFLKMCNFCGRSLHLGKDIFMYRGDLPFCSAECRYQKIVLDEGTGKKGG